MERGRVSDEAVKKATGKTWDSWFALLDKAGGKKMNHMEIAHFLSTRYISNGWWAQMVTVEYERVQGKRKVNENEDGFLVAVHKTVALPVSKLEKAWQKVLLMPAVQKRKLMDLHSKTKRRMIRYKADVGGVVVYFDDRGEGKSRIMVESVKLPSKKSVEENRLFWKKILALV
jgi:hypothetical protein